MTRRTTIALVTVSAASLLLTGCSESNGGGTTTTTPPPTTAPAPPDTPPAQAGGHSHNEVPIGTATVGDLQVTLAQGHGAVAAGKVGHLCVKLPYSDQGASIVRVWIGTDDRTMSMVGKGVYAPSHDDYDVHATAPNPLPPNAMWWIELEKPDGTKMVGSAKPMM